MLGSQYIPQSFSLDGETIQKLEELEVLTKLNKSCLVRLLIDFIYKKKEKITSGIFIEKIIELKS
ncbi:unnamed protein product [marine sediment metagenome]|uniref:Uncharacterized protein n=1 Tax=marine sediment metagenome TaxID=412755 RepID=X1AD17_9ZZZZ